MGFRSSLGQARPQRSSRSVRSRLASAAVSLAPRCAIVLVRAQVLGSARHPSEVVLRCSLRRRSAVPACWPRGRAPALPPSFAHERAVSARRRSLRRARGGARVVVALVATELRPLQGRIPFRSRFVVHLGTDLEDLGVRAARSGSGERLGNGAPRGVRRPLAR